MTVIAPQVESASTSASAVTAPPKRANARVRTYTGYTAAQTGGGAIAWPRGDKAVWEKYFKQDEDNVESIERSIVKHVQGRARTAWNADDRVAYNAVAASVKDRLVIDWDATQQMHSLKSPKRVYYFSVEFLMGRSLDNALLNMGLKDHYAEAIKAIGFDIDDLLEEEPDAALGNGGLGRLAACYMDSLATMNVPAWGYGLRYLFGLFQQKIVNGEQIETPDTWLSLDNPWTLPREDVVYSIRLYGHIEEKNGKKKWMGGQNVLAVAYDVPIPGYDTKTVLNLRLWASRPMREFDLGSFNAGDYDKAVLEAKQAENITAVLYPADNFYLGKELRLKQQYFWVAASLADIVRRFRKIGLPFERFPDKNAIQLNDTHPTLAIVELQRLLVDEEGLSWDQAWDIVTRTFAFTNHTVMAEALETWPVPMLENLLPRHMQIIYDINLFFLQRVERKYPNDRNRLASMSIIEEGHPKKVRMAFLAVIGSHYVNGVAAIHSGLVKSQLFPQFVQFFKDEGGADRWGNVTNGITPRRWMHQCNPALSRLITETLGSSNWLKDMNELQGLAKFAHSTVFQEKWWQVKQENKKRLADYILAKTGIQVNVQSLFNVQVKRIHEYKRQTLCAYGIIHRYRQLKQMSNLEDVVPHTFIIAGKAAPGYYIAKIVIRLITSIANVVNNDPAIKGLMKVVFIPNYNVSVAEMIVPANDISQHISTAGTEASGTSCMKFTCNGGLVLGTVDGANIEIAEEVGEENIFMFGHLVQDVEDLRHARRFRDLPLDPALQAVVNDIRSGSFGDPRIFEPLMATLTIGKDYYLNSDDFQSYLDAIQLVDAAYKDRTTWISKTIMAVSRMGKFSSDRAIQEYADTIWSAEALPLK